MIFFIYIIRERSNIYTSTSDSTVSRITDKILPIVKECQERPLESAKFWLSILNGLKNRGVEDILIACVDGLTVFPQAIVFANDDMAFFGYRVYEKRGHKVGKDLYEAKNTTRALSVELKMVARLATISDCRQSPAFAGFCYCWNRFSDIINIRRAMFFMMTKNADKKR